MPIPLFLLQLAATLFMTGLIWFVQIVHYPLFGSVLDLSGPSGLRLYESVHASRTSWVVFPPMVIELLCALATLSPSLRPAFLTRTQGLASVALVLLLWASTGLLQVPLHSALSQSPTPELVHRLVLSNWLRTALWTTRSALLLYALKPALL